MVENTRPELFDRDIPEQQGALLVKPEAQGHRGQTANTTQNQETGQFIAASVAGLELQLSIQPSDPAHQPTW